MIDQFSKLYPYFQDSINALNHDFAGFLAQKGILRPDDPDLIWLLHSFAFLDARTRSDIQDLKEFYSTFIINALYPELMSESPTVMIAEFSGNTSTPAGSEIICRDKKVGNVKGWTVFDFNPVQTSIAEIKCVGNSVKVQFPNPLSKIIVYVESEELMMSLLSGDRNVYDDGQVIGQMQIPDWGRVVELKNNVYSMIYEHSINRKRFQFVEIALSQNATSITLNLEFPVQHKIDINSLRLNCVPITNLSNEKSEGISINSSQTQYELGDARKILLVIGLNLYNPKNGSVTKLSPSQYCVTGTECKTISIKNTGMIYADLVCINEFTELTEVVSRSGNLVGKVLDKSVRQGKFDFEDKSTLIDLLLINNLSQNTDLMLLVDKVMKFFGQVNEFISVTCSSDYKIAYAKEAWRGVVPQNAIEIKISNYSNFVIALVWGKTFGFINSLNSGIKIRIICEKSVAVFDEI